MHGRGHRVEGCEVCASGPEKKYTNHREPSYKNRENLTDLHEKTGQRKINTENTLENKKNERK